jgi:Mycobacterium membrane protein
MKVLKRAWMPLLIVVVVAIAGFTVYRMHGVFGSDNETTSAGAGLANDAKPFNAKRVTYEFFGPQGPPRPISSIRR